MKKSSLVTNNQPSRLVMFTRAHVLSSFLQSNRPKYWEINVLNKKLKKSKSDERGEAILGRRTHLHKVSAPIHGSHRPLELVQVTVRVRVSSRRNLRV